jgi:endoglucanase Acf2
MRSIVADKSQQTLGLAQFIAMVLALASLCHSACSEASDTDAMPLGKAVLALKPKRGALQDSTRPPNAKYRTGSLLNKAPPTNQWYSSALFKNPSMVIHAHPLSYRILTTGLELSLPDKQLVIPDAGQRAVRFNHHDDVVVEPNNFTPEQGELSEVSAWMATVAFTARNGAIMTARFLHGSPYSYYTFSEGDAKLTIHGMDAPVVPINTAGGHGFIMHAHGHAYLAAMPQDARLELTSDGTCIVHFNHQHRYLTVAGLNDETPATVATLLEHAMVFPTRTSVTWRYDVHQSTVQSTFTLQTQIMEGNATTSLMGLYPHHWSHLQANDSVSPAKQIGSAYSSIRGPIRLFATDSFTLKLDYHGILPHFGPLLEESHRTQVDRLMVGDRAKAEHLFMTNGSGSYWIGKGLGATSQLLNIAEAENLDAHKNDYLKILKSRMESWFDNQHTTYFEYNSAIGSILPHPEEYGSISALNDHHFHYGYWIQAAAQVALRDPAWASQSQWGGLVNGLVSDIATAEPNRSDYPFLRNFDVYEGHSWASGNALMDDGNNQESSSEAIHAWASLLMWAEATHQPALRDLAIMLYTSEIASVQQYWFDINQQVLAPDYGKSFASMVFGGKYAYNTWWTEEPRQIYGINLLPVTPASLYLAQNPDYLRNYLAQINPARKLYDVHGIPDGTKNDVWQDIFAEVEAMVSPDEAISHWNRNGSLEFGETRSHILYWLLSLKELGAPDFSVTADCPLYGVFNTGQQRHHLAYNPSDGALSVHFSDGISINVPPHTLVKQ